MISRLDAESMKWNNESWIAKNITFRSFESNSIFLPIIDSTLKININPMDLIEINTKPNEMNYWALNTFINRLKNNGREFRKWLVDLHFKTAFSFSIHSPCLISFTLQPS